MAANLNGDDEVDNWADFETKYDGVRWFTITLEGAADENGYTTDIERAWATVELGAGIVATTRFTGDDAGLDAIIAVHRPAGDTSNATTGFTSQSGTCYFHLVLCYS